MPHRARHIPPVESGSYPVRQGCAVAPLIDGVPAFRRICEAIESAKERVWGTVAFLEHGAELPDGRGTIFDVLDAAVARGVDVRVIFWRSHGVGATEHFRGTETQRAWLDERGSRFGARWDTLPEDECQHQKSWLIDAGTPTEIAFVGGINLDHGSTVSDVGHAPHGRGSIHDVYLEVRGPAATDVHHNFVQRWNEASERARDDGHWPPGEDRGSLAFPTELSERVGDVPVQISRTVQAGLYSDGTAPPEHKAYKIAAGEFSVYEQYIAAIDAAERTVYIEDQAIGSPKVVGHLLRALERGVHAVLLLPGECHPAYAEGRQLASVAPFFELVASLDAHPRFTMAAIASAEPDGSPHEIYVHAKIMLVDDAWATIGSTNTADRSFKKDTELNASIWHGDVVRTLREHLFAEHLGADAADLDELEAFERFHDVARANAFRKLAGQPLAGLAYRMDAGLYGLGRPKRWVIPDPLAG